MMIKRSMIQSFIVVTCCSFTVMVMSFLFLPEQFGPVTNSEFLFQTFVICMVASSYATIMIHVHVKSIWRFFLITTGGVLCIVFGLGSFVFKIIPFVVEIYSIITILSSLLFWICYFLLNKNDAKRINEQLKKNANTNNGRRKQ